MAKETPDNVSPVMVEEVDNTHDLELPSSIAELPNNQVAVLIKENIERFSKYPSCHFKPPSNVEKHSSTTSSLLMSRQESMEEAHAISVKDNNTSIPIGEPPDSVQDKTLLEIFDDCAWEVECMDNVKKFLFSDKISRKWKDAIAKKVVQIASGIALRNRKLCGELRSRIPGLKLYETKFSKQGRIIWSIAIQFSPRLTGNTSGKSQKNYIYSQVIRLWEIESDHDNLNRSIDRTIDRIIKSISRGEMASKKTLLEVEHDSKIKSVKGEENLLYPTYYTSHETDCAPTEFEGPKFQPAGSAKDDEYNVNTFYSVDNAFIKSMLEGGDARRDFPFKEWPREHDIINMPEGKESILLLGRSGTGKTTCCLYRLWNQFNMYWMQAKNAGPLIPYIPLIMQEKNAEIDMEDAITNYDNDSGNKESFALISEPVNGEASVTDEKIDSCLEHLHQVFITKNYVLCSQMKRRFYDMAAGKTVANEHMEFEHKDIPLKLSEVDSLAFPLFLTARQFFILLDNSLNDQDQFFPRDRDGNLKEKIMSSDYDHENPGTLLDLEDSDSDVEYDGDSVDATILHKKRINKAKMPERREVTSSYFVDKVWQKISKKASLKNIKLDPLLVWMEIKSFIKGSINSIEKKDGHLSRDEYMLLGRKIAHNYADQRDDIFNIFLLYHTYMKHQNDENVFDECDLTKSLYSRLNSLKNLPWSIHSIYVDEVQDFTQAELAILLRVCRNPNNLFLTGDTAQSIMRGISFRFSELRYLFYCAQKQAKREVRAPKITMPEVKHLEINFRSHTGILKLAASIIDLMKRFFPDSFDCLPEDEGMFPGPIPIVLDSCNVSDLALVMRSNKRESSAIEFGAHQVIIVQSEEAKRNIPDVLKAGIVLTVFESKGLEFDDVLLFDFFKFSQVSKLLLKDFYYSLLFFLCR